VDFCNQLNTTEKEMIVTGVLGVECSGIISAIPRVDFPGLCLQDGPVGVRTADLVSVFPAGIAAAATWDRKLMHDRGYALGEEFKAKGAHIHLGYDHSNFRFLSNSFFHSSPS
jgi:beta-glucosidase